MKDYLAQLKAIRNNHAERLSDLSDHRYKMLKPVMIRDGFVYYGAWKPGENRVRYIGNASKPEIRMIREARYLLESISVIDRDISLLESFLANYESVSFAEVNGKLPKTYRMEGARADIRNKAAMQWKQQAEAYKATFEPYRPEDLTQPTIDGNMVRSKSEALIYNYLLENGYTFVYELPLKGKGRTFFPDFTVLSEIDYKTEVRIEHQGMYGNEDYRNGSEAREYDYWKNGFLPGRDVYFTFDDNKGGFDIAPIIDILKARVRRT